MLLIVIGARPIWVLAERELGGLERGRGRLLGTRRVELWDAQPKEGHATATARAGQKPSVPRASDPSLHDREHVSKSRQVKFRNLTKTIEVTPALTPAPSHRTAPLPSVNTSTVLSTRSLGLRIQCSRIQFRVVRSVSQYSGWSAGPMGGPWCSCWRDCVRQSGGGWGRGEGGGGCVNRRHTSAVVSLAIEHGCDFHCVNARRCPHWVPDDLTID